MTLDPADKDRLVKFLFMTTSDNDHEALVSSRLANKLLSKNGVTWHCIVGAEHAAPNSSRTETALRQQIADLQWRVDNQSRALLAEQRKTREAEARVREAEARATQAEFKASLAGQIRTTNTGKRITYDLLNNQELKKTVEVIAQGALSSSAREFVESLAEQIEKRGDLTEKQYAALLKFYRNRR
jgi:phosphoribosylformylglycinamidine (FGAM) synthase PurS component